MVSCEDICILIIFHGSRYGRERFVLVYTCSCNSHRERSCPFMTPGKIMAVIHFENGHHGSSGPHLIRTMSPNFISGRNIKQADKCSKGSLFREWNNSESDNKQRKLGSSKKRGATLYSFSIQH